MKVAFYLNVISPHQLPLAREVVRSVGADNFTYVYVENFLSDRKAMGWDDSDIPNWCIKGDENRSELIEADLLYTGIRCPNLIAKRVQLGKRTYYCSERCFKPIQFGRFLLPGFLRMILPSYRKMAMDMVELLNHQLVKYLSCGPWAAMDMKKIGLNSNQIIPWGYFVEKGKYPEGRLFLGGKLRVLWVGRISWLKRVDTIIKAVSNLKNYVELTIVGDGPDKADVQELSKGISVEFISSQPIEKIREIMRENDVFVFSSNAMDGWGAVVNEALEEGMYVIGTKDTGSCASMLGEEDVYKCGDWRRLIKLLKGCVEKKIAGELKGQGIGMWSASEASQRFLAI